MTLEVTWTCDRCGAVEKAVADVPHVRALEHAPIPEPTGWRLAVDGDGEVVEVCEGCVTERDRAEAFASTVQPKGEE